MPSTSYIITLIIFLLINFAALGIGSFFTGEGVSSSWYLNLNKAPWTPPGWVFGFAWTTIMVCFAFYIASLWSAAENKKLLVLLFTIQWILNVSWNPVFFHFKNISAAFIIISLLTILVTYFFFKYLPDLRIKSLLIIPYVIWMLIATSLNGYIMFQN